MRKTVFVFAGSAAFTVAVAAGLAACTIYDSHDGALSSQEGEPVAPVAPLPPADDAGPDAAAPFACEGLDQDKPVILYVSADDSNSMGSPVYTRELLRQGQAPVPGAIRTYEFLNYYRIKYPAPPAGDLALLPQMMETETPGELDFQIGVRSFDAVKPRRPMTLTFVLDTSGSMAGSPIERERATVLAIAQSLGEGDIVNAVTWNTENNVLLAGRKVTGPDDPELVTIANALSASGGTDLSSGLATGYQLANQHYGADRLNRVILVSDGGANVGDTDADSIGLQSKDADKEGIYLVGVGAGPAVDYNDALMNIVTDKGRGAYVYLDEPAEAARMFTDRFDETMEIAARGVQVEVTLPWYMRMHKFYGEEYSTDPREIEPQHLAPSDAMIFNQVVKACDASVVDPNDTITIVARWQTPLTYVSRETTVTMTVGEMLAAPKAELTKGKAIVAYAEALKAPSAQNLASALALVQKSNPSGTDPELSEIASLLQAHPAFAGP
jgi:Ca-activated chloride channel homolog